jgi:transcriptional regulator with XRE-family HTH domain
MKATTLARRASTSRSTVSNIENGRRGASPEIAERLAAVLGVTVEYLSRGGQV